jgi:hypothetical protein
MEVERLRKKATNERPVDDVEVVNPAAVVRPAPPPPPPRPVVRTRPRPVQAPDVQPVLEVISAAHDTTTVGQRAAPAAAATVQATQRVATVTAGPRSGAASREVLALLRSRQHLRAAIVLQEVFGPPLSRRRR